jgi:hypothetical protein
VSQEPGAVHPAGIASSAIREAIRGETIGAEDAADQPGVISPPRASIRPDHPDADILG